jgi:hypothetical protein
MKALGEVTEWPIVLVSKSRALCIAQSLKAPEALVTGVPHPHSHLKQDLLDIQRIDCPDGREIRRTDRRVFFLKLITMTVGLGDPRSFD